MKSALISALGIFTSLLVATGAMAQDAAVVEHVRSFREGDVFTAELQTKSAWSGSDVQAQFFADAIQIDIGNATLAKGKQIIKVDDRLVRSVYIAAPDKNSVRARINVKVGFSAKSLENRLKVRRSATGLVIEVAGDATLAIAHKPVVDKKSKSLAVVDEETTSSEENVQTHLVAGEANKSAAQDIQETSPDASENTQLALDENSKAPAQATAQTKDSSAPAAITASGSNKVEVKEAKIDVNKLPENQIPVLAEVKDAKKSSNDQFYRIMATLGILAVGLGAALFGLKKWSAKSGGRNINTKIKVLTTHHLGPKKSVAIIQVAGESILIGITDHNISMLKTLALIDDEVPETSSRRFDESMEDFAEQEEFQAPARGKSRDSERTDRESDDFAMRGLSEIRDVVSSRLKNMRNL
jgi:flagellar protein FliO/FliZ